MSHARYDPRRDPQRTHEPSRSQAALPTRPQHALPSRHSLSEASASVIFMGLPPFCNDEGLLLFLEEAGAMIDSASVILDKETGQSKRYGFARFMTVEHARAFVEPNYPAIAWRDRPGTPETGYDGTRIKVDYSQSDKFGKGLDSRGNPRRDEMKEDPALAANDGTRDIGTTPSCTLLLRGLDSLTTVEQIANTLTTMFDGIPSTSKSTSASTLSDASIKRIILIKDRASTASLGFGFVEFVDKKSALDAYKTIMDPKLHPTGFRIAKSPIGATFCHNEVFRPTYAPSSWSYRDDDLGKDLQYWDQSAFGVVHEMSGLKIARELAAASKDSADREEDVSAFLDSLDKEFGVSGDRPAEVPKPSILNAGFIVELKPGEKRKAIEPLAVKKNSAFIQHWNKKKQEETPVVATSAEEKPLADEFPHGDPVKFQCLLCARQLNSVDMLKKHNSQSALHKTNLEDSAKCAAALAKKAELKAASEPQYRDRAAERRVALNQPNHPAIEPSRKRQKNKSPPPPPTIRPNKDGITEDNRGHRLLAAAGWTKGQSLGLGATSGITVPIEAMAYQAGVGIGAAKGTAISQMADPQLERAAYGRDKARDRYNA